MSRRYLGSMMPVVTTLVLLVLAVALVGCSEGGGRTSNNEEAVEMMKWFPMSLIAERDKYAPGVNGFEFTDIAAMRADEDLDRVYEHYLPSENATILKIPSTDIETIAEAGTAQVFEGHFDFGGIRSTLESLAWRKAEYKGVEVWDKTSGSGYNASSVALVDENHVICALYDGSKVVDGCIDALKGEAISLYDNENLRDFVARLPQGIELSAGIATDPQASRQFGGTSWAKEDATTLQATRLYLCDSEEAASKEAAWFDKYGPFNLELVVGQRCAHFAGVTRKGRYVEAVFTLAPDLWLCNQTHE
jgi:hypothetical protein